MTEIDLIRRIQEGETDLFDRLITAHQKDVFRMIIPLVRDSDEADDIVQETFVRAFLNIRKFRFMSAFRTWLIAIGLNLARNALKKRKSFISFDETFMSNLRDDRTYDGPDEAGLKDLVLRIDREVAAFPSMQKLVFLLRTREKKQISGIAADLNLSEGTVKSHLNRAFTRLRKKFHGRFTAVFGKGEG